MIPNKIGSLYGVGLVIASMIGSGVFISTGFMLQHLSPSEIMLEWIIGGIWAICGAVVYVEVARKLPKDGGEVQYVKECIDPFLGRIVGMLTLLLGFACPIAFDALVAGSYLQAISQFGHPQVYATFIVCLFGFLGSFYSNRNVSSIIQQVLVICKVLIVLGIVLCGFLWMGYGGREVSYELPSINRIMSSTFLYQQYWVVYAFSGFNAAIYIVSSFRNPEQDLKRSIYSGVALVFVLYLALNHIFVQVLQSTDIPLNFWESSFTQLTLGHLLLTKIFGISLSNIMSLMLVLIFLSSISAMMQLSVPVCVSTVDRYTMNHNKKDIYIYSLYGIVIISIFLIWSSQVRELLEGISCMIYIVSALTASLILFNRLPTPASAWVKMISFLYITFSFFLLYCGMLESSFLINICVLIVLTSSIAYLISTRKKFA
jgi:basic amino acid/polyamine antiporter, APA family